MACYLWLPGFWIFFSEVVKLHIYRDIEEPVLELSDVVLSGEVMQQRHKLWVKKNSSTMCKSKSVLSWSETAVVHIWVMRGGCDPYGFLMVFNGIVFYFQYHCPLRIDIMQPIQVWMQALVFLTCLFFLILVHIGPAESWSSHHRQLKLFQSSQAGSLSESEYLDIVDASELEQ